MNKQKNSSIITDLKGDKYTSKNPIAQKLLSNFFGTISDLLDLVEDNLVSMTECGCGKGQVTQFITDKIQFNYVNSFDISDNDLAISIKENQKEYINFFNKSIYDLSPEDSSELIVCCEVLEHLKYPEKALSKMASLKGKYYLLSVPNEPIWRILNFLRGKYMKDWGNTPDHVNHWSTNKFIEFVAQHLDVIAVKKPLPWTMILAKLK